MYKISETELKNRLRKVFHDEYKIQWSDEILDGIITEARREYAFYSGSVTGFHKVTTSGGEYELLPEDFFQVMGVFAPDGKSIPVVSYRKLIEEHGDFRKDTGSVPKAFCFNFDDFGRFRIYPRLPAGTFAGSVFYKKLPDENNNTFINSRAVELYALFLMCQFSGKKQAVNYFASFQGEIYLEQRQRTAAGNKNIGRTGIYY